MAPTVIKKYSNRRLYDTDLSRYITQEELASKIRAGTDVQVLDAKTGQDLTQATLTQIIIESRGASRMLPVPLLTQLIRLGDDSLAEFLGRYVSAALELYNQIRQGAQSLTPLNPLAMLPFTTTQGLAQLFNAMGGRLPRSQSPQEHAPEPQAPSTASELEELRRELEELKRAMGRRRR